MICGRSPAPPWLAQVAVNYLWDFDGWLAITDGATQAQAAVWCGDVPAAAALITEAGLVAEATGTLMAPLAAMFLAALRGRESEAAPLIEATIAAATVGGQGLAVSWTRWMTAILRNGLGRYTDAEAAARQASQDMPESTVSMLRYQS